ARTPNRAMLWRRWDTVDMTLLHCGEEIDPTSYGKPKVNRSSDDCKAARSQDARRGRDTYRGGIMKKSKTGGAILACGAAQGPVPLRSGKLTAEVGPIRARAGPVAIVKRRRTGSPP